MLETYNYDTWFKNKKLSDNVRETDEEESIDLFDMPPLEGDEEELKEAKGLTILTPNKLLARLPILLAQIKARNNSYKFKNEIRQILYLLYQHNKITKKRLQQFNQVIIIMEENMSINKRTILTGLKMLLRI